MMCRRFGAAGLFGGSAGGLPGSGGVSDQPAALVDAFAMLDVMDKEAD